MHGAILGLSVCSGLRDTKRDHLSPLRLRLLCEIAFLACTMALKFLLVFLSNFVFAILTFIHVSLLLQLIRQRINRSRRWSPQTLAGYFNLIHYFSTVSWRLLQYGKDPHSRSSFPKKLPFKFVFVFPHLISPNRYRNSDIN
jgi:hypothetical protein